MALILVAVAVLTVLSRLPSTLSDLNAKAKRNDAYNAVGRQMASADSLDIDNGIAGTAITLLPRNATFAVLPPGEAFVRSQNIAPLTIAALAPYFRYLLLPRREVTAPDAEYLICYGCDPRPWRDRVRWIWTDENGLRIGRAG